MRSKAFFKRNSATILTCLGAAGVVGTALLTGKASIKANNLVKEAKKVKGEDLTFAEKIKVTAPVYIPPILLGATTITCIFGANILNKKTQASLAGAYALLDQSYKDYKNKVIEMYGDDVDRKIVESIAEDYYRPRRTKT